MMRSVIAVFIFLAGCADSFVMVVEPSSRRRVDVATASSLRPIDDTRGPKLQRIVVLLSSMVSFKAEPSTNDLSKLAKYVLSDRGGRLRSLIGSEVLDGLDVLSRKALRSSRRWLPFDARDEVNEQDEAYLDALKGVAQSILDKDDSVRKVIEKIVDGKAATPRLAASFSLDLAQLLGCVKDLSFEEIDKPRRSQSMRAASNVLEMLDEEERVFLRGEVRGMLQTFVASTADKINLPLPPFILEETNGKYGLM